MNPINPTFNPFPGLRPFEQHESHLFFGREGQGDELLRRLRRTRFLAVVGTSGSGKSSLMRAGLLPALHGGFMAQTGSRWHVALMRPGADPIGNLAHALSYLELFKTQTGLAGFQAAMLRASLSRSSLGLVETARQAPLPADENLLVVVDQFEELFRFKQEAQKAGHGEIAADFVQLLLEAGKQTEAHVYVVLTMRSDFLGDCAQFRDLPEAINDGQYLIPRMTREQRRTVITGPVAVGKGEITSRLVNRLLNDVGDNPDQLPILQHALMRTWDYWQAHRQNSEPLDLRHCEDIGGMNAALSRHADEAFQELPDDSSRKIAELVFKRLTEKGADNREMRRPTSLQELAEVAQASVAEVTAVIECFRKPGRSFLMPPPEHELTPQHLIDISHESLIRNWKLLVKWVEEEARAARICTRLAEDALLHQQGQTSLWRDPQLSLALQWRDEQRPNPAWAARYNPNFNGTDAFLTLSAGERDREAKERERRRLERERLLEERAELAARQAEQQRKSLHQTRYFAAAIAFFLVIAIFAAWTAIRNSREAERQTLAANHALAAAYEQKALAAIPDSGANVDFQHVWLYAAAALQQKTSPDKLPLSSVAAAALFDPGILRTAFSEKWSSPSISIGSGVRSVAFSPDGKTLASGSEDQTLRLWDWSYCHFFVSYGKDPQVWRHFAEAIHFLWQSELNGLEIKNTHRTPRLSDLQGYYFEYDLKFRHLLNPPKPGQSKFEQILEWAKEQAGKD